VRDAGDEEPRGVVPEEAHAGANEEEQHGVEPVVEHPREQDKVVADVVGAALITPSETLSTCE
jgi:hypothetical protein